MPDEADKLAPPSTARRMAAGGVNINRLLDLRPWQSGPWDMEYGEAPTDLPEFRPAEWRHARALRDRFWEALRGRQLGCSSWSCYGYVRIQTHLPSRVVRTLGSLSFATIALWLVMPARLISSIIGSTLAANCLAVAFTAAVPRFAADRINTAA